jgi:DNA topoisomerase IB
VRLRRSDPSRPGFTRRERDEQKFDRCLELAPLLPEFRRAIEDDLASGGHTRRRVLAMALRMLDHGVFRVGGDEYVEQYGTHGAATLRRDHVCVRNGMVVFDFPAKGGIDRKLSLPDRPLAKAVAGLRRARSGRNRLLVYPEDRGWREIHAEDVNLRFKELVGEQHTVKDLRTWNATVLAAAELAAKPVPGSAHARHRGNTPAVAKKSYVDPRLLDRYEDGVDLLSGLGDVDLEDPELRAKVEHAVVELLTD